MSRYIKRTAAVVLVFIIVVGGGALWLKNYIAPQQTLDLSYGSVDVKQKLLDMIRRLEPMLILTEEDIDSLIKMELSLTGGAVSNPDIRIDGAEFELDRDKLTANMNITYKNRLPVGMTAVYKLSWQDPSIVLEPQSVKVRNIPLPLSLVEPVTVELPVSDLVRIKDMKFDRDQIKISFAIQNIL